MKMKSDDYAALLGLIEGTMTERGVDLREQLASYRRSGLSDARFYHDMLWSCPYAARQTWFDRGIYSYLDDSHIRTALKRVFKELTHAPA
ncbi:MAG: hypothetical protein KI788_06290 [Mameliella sp.]|nr:hypothetical protein [Mameliella sp.]